MISTSLNHCKEMGAEPGRRPLKMPAEKLGPVIVVLATNLMLTELLCFFPNFLYFSDEISYIYDFLVSFINLSPSMYVW